MQKKLHKSWRKSMEDKLDKIIQLLTNIEQIQANNPYAYWTLAQEIYVKEMYDNDVDPFNIALGIKEKFGISRSTSAIKKRISEMGLKITTKRNPAILNNTIEGIF